MAVLDTLQLLGRLFRLPGRPCALMGGCAMVGGCVFVGSVLLASVVAAAPKDQAGDFLNPQDREACWGRNYDDAHMRAHPRQKVVRIYLFTTHNPPQGSDEQARDSDSDSHADHSTYALLTLRGDHKPSWFWSTCMKEREDLPGRCVRECDRTLAHVTSEEGGSVLLSDFDRYLYLDGDDADTAQTPAQKAENDRKTLGEDDTRFRLKPLPIEACRAEFARIDNSDTSRGEPLRVRLQPAKPFCYGRDYDARHLSRHPQQQVSSIRLWRGPAEIAAEHIKPQDWPNGAQVVAALTRKGQSKVERKYQCSPKGDQWLCTHDPAAPQTAQPAGCGVDASGEPFNLREIFLRRAAEGNMMLGNPGNGLPPFDNICAKPGDTKSDDKVFRLSPMPLSACGL